MIALETDIVQRLGSVFRNGRRGALAVILRDASPGIACEIVLDACRSVGGDPRAAFPAAAALQATVIAIGLVDHVLDDELDTSLNAGRTANLGSAMQAAAFEFLAELQPAMHSAVTRRFAAMLIDTACGQERDVMSNDGVGDAWDVVDAKTIPLFEAAYYCGALLGGSPVELARRVEGIGGFVGRLIQVQDDLKDVLEPGVDADWRRPHGNLALRFALCVEHPQRDEVRALLGDAGCEGAARSRVREILGTCGAIAYCISSVVVLADQARRYVDQLPIDGGCVLPFVERLAQPARTVLSSTPGDESAVTRRLVEMFA
jgi:hypothetical protein